MKALIMLILVTTASLAEDWQIPGGRKYLNVTVTGKDALTVTISHASGVARLNWLVLTPDQRSKLGFDQAKYDDALLQEKKRQAITEKAAKDWAKAVRIRVKIFEIVSEGIITEPIPELPLLAPPLSSSGRVGGSGSETKSTLDSHRAEEKSQRSSRPKASASGEFLLSDHPLQSSLVSGAIIDVDALEVGFYNHPPDSGHRIKKFRVLKVHPAAK